MVRIHVILAQAWRSSRLRAIRLWYDGPAALMAAYLSLSVAAEALGPSARMQFKPAGYALDLVLAFLCWRVWRGGAISRGFLIYLSAVEVLTATEFGQRLTVQAVAVLTASLGGLMLLLSPAVYTRTHPGGSTASAGIRLRPRRWMVVAAPLGGVAVAGLTLAVTRRWFLPGSGCMIGPVEDLPRRCVGVGRGFPVPVVATTVHGHPAVSQVAYVNDCAQWTLLIFTVIYLLWLAVHRRDPPGAGPAADLGVVAQPSQ